MDSIAHHHRPVVVAYFDVDCFYAQSEILRRPHLLHHPVGVTQKSLVVTCNYMARQLGVPKMASIQEAKKRCPNLILFNGEDLTPYRAASKNIMAVIGRFGVLERRGLDEAALDITSEVLKRVVSMPTKDFSGHVIGLEIIGVNENDIKVSYASNTDQNISDYYIMVGSQVVAEIRVAVEKETGFQCSAGIAFNKMLAKLVSSVNKPNKQTCILRSAVSAFLEPLHIRKLPGVGHRTESMLNEMGVTTVADLQQISLQQLSARFGSRMGMLLYENCRGVDNSLVQNKGPPKSLSVEDSFQPCSSFKQAGDIVRRLAVDFIARLDEDKEEYARRPNVITMKWRYLGNWSFKSASASMPLEALSTSIPMENRIDSVVSVSMKLLTNAIGGQPFSLVVLNIGATNFVSNPCESNGVSRDIRSFFNGPRQGIKYVSKVVSKREARAFREDCEKLVSPFILSNYGQGIGSNARAQCEGKLDIEEEEHCEDEWMLSPSIEEQVCLHEKLTSTPEHATYTACIGRMDNDDVRVDEHLNAKTEEEVLGNRTHSSGSLLSDTEDSGGDLRQFICEKCGQELDDREPQSRQEHNDYHLALDLHSEEQLNGHDQSSQVHNDYCFALDLSSQEHISRKSIGRPSIHHLVKGKYKNLKQSSKRRRTQNATLDCYVYRTQC